MLQITHISGIRFILWLYNTNMTTTMKHAVTLHQIQ